MKIVRRVLGMLKYRLRGVEQHPVPAVTQRPVPAVLQTHLAGLDMRFEAIVKEDYSRILEFDGERAYFETLLSQLRPDDCFLDVGAFTGQVSCFAAAKCCKGMVLAVEPDAELCGRIRSNLDLNSIKNVEIVQVGLASHRGILGLNTSGGTGWAPSFIDKGLAATVDTPVMTLDELLNEQGARPNVMKIDVEGFGGHVFRGGEKALSDRCLRAVFIEFHPGMLLATGERIENVLGALSKHGFRFTEFAPRKNEISAVAVR